MKNYLFEISSVFPVERSPPVPREARHPHSPGVNLTPTTPIPKIKSISGEKQ
jgi:hypothetical protein